MKKDPSLDFLRDAAGRLLVDGVLTGYLASSVSPFWGLGRPLRLQERVWMTIEWTDGQRDDEIEDYEPWVFLRGSKRGGSTGTTNLMRAATRSSGSAATNGSR